MNRTGDIIVIVAFINYDTNRFDPYRKYAKLVCCDIQGLFVLGEFCYMDQAYINAHQMDFLWLESQLQDERSRHYLSLFLEQKVSGIYQTDYESEQYFPKDIIELTEQEVFVDCGAYNGDSVLAFVNTICNGGINDFSSIFAFEPDEQNQNSFLQNTEGIQKINLIRGGVWNEKGTLTFHNNQGASSSLDGLGDAVIPVYSIDSVLRGHKATYIKMDVEGSELRALIGAKNTIRKWHPKLAVCVYHKIEDLITIPKYLKELDTSYKFYLRKHSPAALEMVLYAI